MEVDKHKLPTNVALGIKKQELAYPQAQITKASLLHVQSLRLAAVIAVMARLQGGGGVGRGICGGRAGHCDVPLRAESPDSKGVILSIRMSHIVVEGSLHTQQLQCCVGSR